MEKMLTAALVLNAGPQDGPGQRSVPKNKKKAQEKRNLAQTSRLSINGKNLERDIKRGNVLTATQQLSTHPTTAPVAGADGPSGSSESTSSNLPPIKSVPVRPKEGESCAELCSNGEGPTGDNEFTQAGLLKEDLLPFDLSSASCDQTSRVGEMSPTQAEVGVGELPHWSVWQRSAAADPTAEPSSAGQRQTRDHRKSFAAGGSALEGEESAFSPRSPGDDSEPGSTSRPLPASSDSAEDWPGGSIHGRQRQALENSQRCYARFITSVRPVGQRPSAGSAFNVPGPSAWPANRAEASGNVDVATASVQVTELIGSPRLVALRQLSPLRVRDSFSGTESCPSSSPTISTFEDSGLLEETLSNGLSSVSPSTASHEEDVLLTSHNSSSSRDSPQPSLFRGNFTAHLHMTGTLPDPVPIFLTVSDLRNPGGFMSSATVCSPPNTKEQNKPETDPEKLKKLQER